MDSDEYAGDYRHKEIIPLLFFNDDVQCLGPVFQLLPLYFFLFFFFEHTNQYLWHEKFNKTREPAQAKPKAHINLH